MMDQMDLEVSIPNGELLPDARELSRFEPQTVEGRYLKAIYLAGERTKKAQIAQSWYLFALMVIAVVFVIGAAVLVGRLSPAVTNLASEIEALTTQTSTMVAETSSLIAETSALVQSMSQTDFDGLVSASRDFVDSSSESAAEALAKINAIDIKSLNDSIRSLAVIIKPLARLLGG